MSRHANPIATTIETCQFCSRWIALRAGTLQGKRQVARQHGWLASQALGMMLTCPDCAKRNKHHQRRPYQNGRGKLWQAFEVLKHKGVDVSTSWQQWLEDEDHGNCRTRRPVHLNPWDANGNLLKPIRLDVGEGQLDIVQLQNVFVSCGLHIDRIEDNNMYISQ